MPEPFGAILAGGQNRRYGSHKALAHVAGEPILERVRRALCTVTRDLILIANDAHVFRSVGIATRADARPGLGPLGGVYTGLLWAREAGRPGTLAVACDMPFLSAALLQRLIEKRSETLNGEGEVRPDVVAPESNGPRGVEPLCAYYSTRCIPAIEAAVARDERHLTAFCRDVRVLRMPLQVVRTFGEPDILFLNVNTPGERERAERIAGPRVPPETGD